VPVIISEAPPSTWEHPHARRMFANGHTDYCGPPRLKPSSAQTRVKKAVKPSKDIKMEPDSSARGVHPTATKHPETAASPPPARPFKVVSKVVVPKELAPSPPPSRPFKVVSKTAKAVPHEVIELTSASDSAEIVTAQELDTDYEDDAPVKKRKRKAGTSHASKKRAPSDDLKKTKDKKGKEPETLNAKGGSLSPLTVGSSGDEQHSVMEG
jgi:hypothetical protein